MKKIIYILFAALLGAVSCNVIGPEVSLPQEDGKVTIMMHVNFPEVLVNTKATTMAETPNIDNIYVAVFGGNHYLNEYVKAVPCDANSVKQGGYGTFDSETGEYVLDNNTDFWFQVTLSATTSKRYVHVFANGPESIDFDDEEVIMKTLTTTDPVGSYWTYLVLPHGTASIADDGKPSPLPEAETLFRNLKLIRNFARIKLDVAENVNFELTGYQVYNTPTHGSVAVWSENAAGTVDEGNDGYFRDYYTKSMAELLSSYTPFMPNDEMNSDRPTPTTTYNDSNDKFVFERPDAQTNRPYIIMQGKFGNDENDTFYRLELVDPDGNYLPIYRNHEYLIHLNAVAKRGAADPTQAKASNANVSSATGTENLSDLSNGISRIYVQWLDQAYMESGTKTFQYMYLPDASDPSSTAEATLEIRQGAGAAISGQTAAEAFTTSGPDSQGWYTVTFTTTEPGNTEKITKFRVTGQKDDQKLYRDITVRVLNHQPWGTPGVTTSGSEVNSTVDVTFTLPTTLPPSLFPLEIALEDSNHSLDPVGINMPAVIGPSIVPDKNGSNSYQFIKTVSYLEYTADGGNVVTCNFRRVKAGGTTLYFSNKYFTLFFK